MNVHTSSTDVTIHNPNPGAMINLEPIRFDSPAAAPSMEVVADWTKGLPVFAGQHMVLRELVKTDAASLLSMLSIAEVAKFISPTLRGM